MKNTQNESWIDSYKAAVNRGIIIIINRLLDEAVNRGIYFY